MTTSTIGDWFDQQVIPELFDRADHFFPEFAFKRTGNGWNSTTPLKADGSQGTQKGKVYLYENTPFCLQDYRLDKPVTLWSYLAEREGLTSNGGIVRYFSELTGVPLPVSPTPVGQKHKGGVHPAVLKAAHGYMQLCLQHHPSAKDIRDYLNQRGYTETDIQAMQLGFLPSLDVLSNHLHQDDHSHACVKFFMRKLYAGKKDKPQPPIGTSHQIVLPCFGAGQRLEGFTFRCLDTEQSDKYLNMGGLKKSVALMNFPRRSKDVTVVEGIFDSKIAKARGLQAVVPMNGTHLHTDIVKAMTDQGVERLTLCLDNDDAGIKATYKIVRKLLSQCPEMRLFIAQLPDDVKDPDELIKTQGIEAFQASLDTAINAGEYLASIYKPRIVKHNETGMVPKQRDEIFTYCLEAADSLSNPQDKFAFISAMSEVLPELGMGQGMLFKGIASRA